MRTNARLIVAFGLLVLSLLALGSFQVVNTASSSVRGTDSIVGYDAYNGYTASSSAATLVAPKSGYGNLYYSSDQYDQYKVAVVSGDKVTFHFVRSATTSYIDLYFYNNAKTQVYLANNVKDYTYTVTATGSGYAYLAIDADSSVDTGNYYLEVTKTGSTPSDTTAPTVSISSPASGATVSGTVTISFTASDANGISSRAIKIDGVTKSTSSSYSWATTAYSNGAYTIQCTATDPSGNTGSDTHTVTVSNTVVDDGGALTDGVAASGHMNSADGSDMYWIDVAANAQSMYVVLTCGSADFDTYGRFNAQPTTSTYDWRGYTSGGEENTVTSPAQGRHYIMVQYYSGDADYSLTATVTYGAPADTTAPTVSISSPASGATVSGTVTISFTASDANGISSRAIKIDGVTKSTSSSYSWDTTAYSNGAHTIVCTATDPSGNTGSDTHSVTVSNTVADTTAPSVSISAPANGATVSGTTTISFTASDANGISSRAIKIDGVTKSTSSSYSWDTTAYTNAAHTIRCEATDPSGNTGYQQISVTVSNSAPADDGGLLTDGVAANGNMDSADGADMFWINVGPNALSMYVVLTCGSADFDTYGRFNAQPTTSTYDWRGYTSGGEENTVNSPAEGRHYIMVDYYSGSGPYTLTATITYGGGGGSGSWGTGGKYAVIVGISDYQSISDLSFCDEDATDWYNFLIGRGYECHVFGDNHPSNYPRYDGLATEANVRAAIQELANHAVSGDKVFFVTSGHGSGTGTGSSYLCMYDCSGSAGCYYDTEIAADFSGFNTGVGIMIFIDHCYSGGIGPELMNLSQQIYCTTTCTQNGYGYDEPTYQNGAWTYEYLQKYWVNSPTSSAESIYDQASATYPHTGGDACMEFDGYSGSFYA